MAAVTIRVPTPLRKLTNNAEEVSVDAATVQDMIASLEKQYPGMKDRLCDEAGEVRRFINVFLNDEDVRFLKGRDTELKDGDVVSIVPAIAGGAARIRKKYYLNVPQKLIREPIIYQLIKKFDVVPNIRQASVSEEIGIVAVEMEGEPSAVESATRYLQDMGVSVEPIEINVIEG
ncbi:MoaD family protein [bacterium]|nr:MoaD family protein [bacterium]